MSIAHHIHRFLSKYASNNERDVARFFAKVNENMQAETIKRKTVQLIQKDIIAVNLWSEYKYRQYKYLSKAHRRRLYANCQIIAEDFVRFSDSLKLSQEEIVEELQYTGVDSDVLGQHAAELAYLYAIMQYLSPHAGRYVYRKSSTFGALLKDPSREKLVGDCNQIVTLYIYLFSLKFDVSKLQITLIPGHVAIHLNGLYIEATEGRFVRHTHDERKVLPIEEIVSVNLLDQSDDYFKTHKVPAEAFLESARIAHLISSQRDIVEKNLPIAYRNAVIECINNHLFDKAMEFAKSSNRAELVENVSENAVAYYLGQKQFKKALHFSQYSKNKQALDNVIMNNQGADYFNKHDYKNALIIFGKINDTKSAQACYSALCRAEISKLGDKITTESLKNNKNVLQTALHYAKKSGENDLIEYVEKLKTHL